MCGAGEADLVTKTKAGITCMDWFYSGVGSSCRADAGMPPRVYTLKDVCVQDGKQYQVLQQSCSGCGRAGLGLPNCRNPAPVRGTGLQVGRRTTWILIPGGKDRGFRPGHLSNPIQAGQLEATGGSVDLGNLTPCVLIIWSVKSAVVYAADAATAACRLVGTLPSVIFKRPLPRQARLA